MDRRREALWGAYLLERRAIERDSSLTAFSRAVAMRRAHSRYLIALSGTRGPASLDGEGDDGR
jgi:hypothetical protein